MTRYFIKSFKLKLNQLNKIKLLHSALNILTTIKVLGTIKLTALKKVLKQIMLQEKAKIKTITEDLSKLKILLIMGKLLKI